MRSTVIDHRGYDWEGDTPLRRPMSESVIYELHVGGFTKDPSSGVKNPGTFKGIIEKIPYLKELGITAVELLPVFEFDETETLRVHEGKTLTNYWGYSTLSFFAPEADYCVSPEEGSQLIEFRDMVKALHKAGIEVILDVVFNHSNEGNHQGPTINFKGFDNSIYYYLVNGDKQYYMDYSGCGNTLNCNHPIVDKMIVECLEFWVREMHVDGFRFDEGSVLTRDQNGGPMAYPPVIWNIELSETLLDSKVIAEAWDAAGLYQIGYFPGYRWAEWNGKYRDAIRRFMKGDPGILGDVANRIAGSADLYESHGHLPVNSVNFICCHDGFTLNDLVSYNEKHNWANGEGNNDGANDNNSWNCGAEGSTDDPGVNSLRDRQVKNFAAILFISQGVPMITMGDEMRRTQGGNNNAYCQDNPIGWMNWDDLEKHKGAFRFFSRLIRFRRRHPALHRSRFFTGKVNVRGLKDEEWHGPILYSPGWNDPNGKALAFTLAGEGDDLDIHVMMNMHWDPIEFQIPPVKGRRWFRFADTSLPSPQDAADTDFANPVSGSNYRVNDRSVVILVSGK
jgi:glycogen operon protein